MDQYNLIFQPIHKTISTCLGHPRTVLKWDSYGLSYEGIKAPYTSNYSLSPKPVRMSDSKIRLRFTGSFLKQEDNTAYNSILILGKGETQGLDNTKLTAEAEYSMNFSRSKRKFCLS